MKTLLILFFALLTTFKVVALSMTHLEHTSGIYCIQNIVNGKKYIGETSSVKARWTKHISDLNLDKHFSKELQKDFNIYGVGGFKVYTLIECQKKHRLDLERYFVDLFKPYYNTKLDEVGEDGLTKRQRIGLNVKRYWENNPEAREIVGERIKKLWKTSEYRKKHREKVSKSVIQLDLKTGEFIKEWLSAKEAGKFLNVSADSIGRICRGGKNKFSSAGFRWKFKDGVEQPYRHTRARYVKAINIKTLEKIGPFESIKKASEATGCSRGNISSCLSGRYQSSKGFKWYYLQLK